MNQQTPKDDITIRPLQQQDEYTACIAIQAEVWGGDPAGFTSTALLKATQHAGGVVAGTFTPTGELIGFVYSFIGRIGETNLHWSHQLAVLPAYAGQDIGRRLKIFQRDEVMKQGFSQMRWTFDPMMSINAYFNLNKLGAVCNVYMPNKYGAMVDDLNQGMPSDRFECHWYLDRVTLALKDKVPRYTLAMWRKAGAHQVNPTEGLNPPTSSTIDKRCAALLIAIPTDFTAIKRADKAQALAWQTNIRESFTQAFAAGYEARYFIRGEELGYYVLLKGHTTHAD